MVQNGVMPFTKQVRRSITLPTQFAQRVQRIAKKRRLSDNRVLVEQGLEVQEEKKLFFALAKRFREVSDPNQVKALADAMRRFIFGQKCRISKLGLDCRGLSEITLPNECGTGAPGLRI